jgi:hypothetical protein
MKGRVHPAFLRNHDPITMPARSKLLRLEELGQRCARLYGPRMIQRYCTYYLINNFRETKAFSR